MFELDKVSFSGIQPVSMRIDAGECVGLSGVSGCGKTRLLRALADMDEHQGAVLIDGVRADAMPAHEWRSQIALLPAESQWWYDIVGAHFLHYDDELFGYFGFTKAVMMWDISRLSSG